MQLKLEANGVSLKLTTKGIPFKQIEVDPITVTNMWRVKDD